MSSHVGAWIQQEAALALEPLAGQGQRWAIGGSSALHLYLGGEFRRPRDLDMLVFVDDLSSKEARLAPLLESSGFVRIAAPRPGSARFGRPGERAVDLSVVESPGRWRWQRSPEVSLSWEQAILRDAPVPYLAPEIVFLSKVVRATEQDLADAREVWPRLDLAARAWVRGALATVGISAEGWLEQG